MKRYLPIFVSETEPPRRFVGVRYGWHATDKHEAWNIGWGVALVEGIICGFKFSGEVLELEESADGKAEIAHYRATMGRGSTQLNVEALMEALAPR